MVEEVHGGEGDGDHAEHEVRHRQVEDEDVPGVGLHVARHRGHQDGDVAQEAEDRDGEVADQEEVVPPVLHPVCVMCDEVRGCPYITSAAITSQGQSKC